MDKLYSDTARTEITKDNVGELECLCDELGFRGLADEVQSFKTRKSSRESVRKVKKPFVCVREVREMKELEWRMDEIGDELWLTQTRAKELEEIGTKVYEVDTLLKSVLKRVDAHEKVTNETAAEVEKFVKPKQSVEHSLPILPASDLFELDYKEVGSEKTATTLASPGKRL